MTSSRVQPQIVIPDNIEVIASNKIDTPNGVKLYTLLSSDQNVVRVSFVFRAGSSLQSVPFSASATANLLSEGTSDMTSQQIAEQLDFFGSYYDVTIDRDYTVITFCSLSKFFAPTMKIADQILLHPTFEQSEVETYCSKRKERLGIERSKVAFKARELFAQTLFGENHPYGISSPQSMYDTLTREDIEALYKRLYTAQNCFVVCSGDVDQGVIDNITDITSQLPAAANLQIPAFSPIKTEKFGFISQPGALQSAIRIGRLLFPRSHPDYIAMQVVTTILGGYFGSRLVKNLREERGYTYGVFAGVVNLEYEGYLAIASEVASETTDDAIAQIFIEIERLRSEIVSQEELQMVKNIVVGEVMRILDGPFGIADVAIENIQNGTDNSYLNDFIAQIRCVTPEQVLLTAKRYLTRESFSVVVVGHKTLTIK